MVQKMYHANSGQILIDGVDVRLISTTLLREKIAVVPQEPKLFSMSVAENVSYRPVAADSAPALVEQMVQDAATTANADAFVRKLEGGYEYEVGKFGGKLSGGQCQRVAIARSLYGPSDSIKILLLDEATSALDNESENLVQEALSKASVGRTTIIVAHRLSTIQHVDQIFVIDHGRCIEQGTFEELCNSKKTNIFGAYAAAKKAANVWSKHSGKGWSRRRSIEFNQNIPASSETQQTREGDGENSPEKKTHKVLFV
jgi:ABC-type multidrug transport system fused ATPase/permease subunit